jgi:putative ABC transport system substrate-binding protein
MTDGRRRQNMTGCVRFLFAVLMALAVVQPAMAQHAEKVYRIGLLHSADIARSAPSAAFFKALRGLGFEEGRNITILRRSAKGDRKRLAYMAAELVRLKVDLIVGPGSGIRPAIKATRTIPIVVTVAGDYVARGWAKSLHRPGGNVTGLSTQADDLMGKQMELLKETVPGLKRLAIVYTPNLNAHSLQIKQAKHAAPALGLEFVTIPVNAAADLPGAFRRMKDERVGGFLVLRSGFLVRLRNRMYALATKARLPSISGHVRETAAGGLMSYGADTVDLYRRAAEYVDRILKGARPGDLPIAQPEKFIMAVNLKTARTLGVTFPQSVQLRADTVIE